MGLITIIIIIILIVIIIFIEKERTSSERDESLEKETDRQTDRQTDHYHHLRESILDEVAIPQCCLLSVSIASFFSLFLTSLDVRLS